jgi:hypothetical protein
MTAITTTTTRIPAERITIGDVSEGCTAVDVSWDGDVVVIEWQGNDDKGSTTLRYRPAAMVKVTETDAAPTADNGTHTEVTDRLAARAVRNADLDKAAYAEGLMTAWEMVTGVDDADAHEHLHAAAARHNTRRDQPVFVKDSAGFWIGVGDEVRIGKHGTGKVLWRIVSVDGDMLHMVDDLTGRKRKADKGHATLSIEGSEAYAARAAQNLHNIF